MTDTNGHGKPLRLAMPRVAVFVDACRESFGRATVDQAMRNARAGGTDFWASENGREFGGRPAPPGASFSVDQPHRPTKAMPCRYK